MKQVNFVNIQKKFILILLVLCRFVYSFNQYISFKPTFFKSLFRLKSSITDDKVEKYTAVPGLEKVIRPSIFDKARTITHVCTSGTLCTLSIEEGVQGSPFGSYVDYILDDNGWPVMLLSEQSLHTLNIKSCQTKGVSLFCQLPRSQSGQSAAALSRVTLIGNVEPVKPEDLSAIRLAFTLVHQYAEQIVDSRKF